MRQPSLYEARRLARRDDPVTSKLAAKAIVDSLGEMKERVLALVRKWPGSTASELAKYAEEADPRRVNRRLPELERRGLIERGQSRECDVTGREAVTWIPKP